MSRLDELLSRDLIPGCDDKELDELARLLDTYRRRPASGWQPCELDGRPAHRRVLECGHVEIILGPEPQVGRIESANGTDVELPLSAVCSTCARVQANA